MKFFLKILFIFSLFVIFVCPNFAQTWFRHYGGTSDDYGKSIQQTSDGGYIVAGETESFTYGNADFAIYKLNSSGNKVWFKHYGGSDWEEAFSIQQTSDGGYIVAGYTGSYTYGYDDFAIYKLNSSGNKTWFKHYGGTDFDSARSIQQTSDGGYIVAGDTTSYTHGGYDFAIYKLNSSGNKVWFKHYGGSQDDHGHSIQQTSDGGYIVGGRTESFTYGGMDFAIYKLNSNGNKIWFKHYGGMSNEWGRSIQQTSDGGYIVAGYTESYTYGNYDFAVYKLNSSGNKVWFKHYGGTSHDHSWSIQQTSDGGYVVAGESYSYSYGLYDFAIYKLNSLGNKIWFKHYGGTAWEVATSIQQTTDGGYVVTGRTDSYTHGGTDIGIYKLDSNGNK